MKNPKKNIDLCSILNATSASNSIIDDLSEKLYNYQNDEKYKERLEYHYCKVCFYVRTKMGGAAMTSQECGICENEMVFSSTCTDCLCFDCAKKYKLCAHCGGDINQKNRRKFELKEE